MVYGEFGRTVFLVIMKLITVLLIYYIFINYLLLWESILWSSALCLKFQSLNQYINLILKNL